MKILFELFLIFAKIGGFTFGGGYAMLPILEREIVDNKKYITKEQLVDFFAIGQCTPGIIAINVATFVGYKKAGILGGIFATLGMVFPSLIIISAIAGLLDNFYDNEFVIKFLSGVSVAVSYLIITACVSICKSSFKTKYSIMICAASFLVSYFFAISPIYIILVSIVLGTVISLKKEV